MKVNNILYLSIFFASALSASAAGNKPVEMSNIYYNNASDMIVRPTTMNNTSKGYYKLLTGTSVSNDVTSDNFKNGYLEITVPDKIDYPRDNATESKWTKLESDNNVVDFHICLGSKPYRINDANNTLSATGEKCTMKGCTGAYVGIKAPQGCRVKAYLCLSTISEETFLKDKSGTSWNPNFYGTVAPAVFDFDEVCDGTYKEMTSGAPYNCLAGMNYMTDDWPTGYCIKYIDVAVYGVKPGDKVGFGGIQTLHEGWTPIRFVKTSEVSELIEDSNAPIEYYNLQGIKMDQNSLTPGVYIKRQGNRSSKHIIK